MNFIKSDTLLNRNSYYEASVQRPNYAPLQTDLTVDAVVVGGGFSGLSAALELAEQGMQVALLEAEQVCFGASGRNGGQAIVGYACGQAVLEKAIGMQQAKIAWDMSCEAVDLIDQRIARYGLECDRVHGYLYVADSARKAKALLQESRDLEQRYGLSVRIREGTAMRQDIDSPRYQTSVFENRSGHLHPLKYGLGLARAVQQAGVQIFEKTPVLQMQRGEQLYCSTPQGQVRARFAVLAGNCLLPAMAPELAPEIGARTMPVGTYILATDYLPEALVQRLIPSNASVCDNNFVLDYFRFSTDRRLLFGGRVSYTGWTPPRLKERLLQRVGDVFPDLRGVGAPYVWGGFVDVSMNRAPDFGRLAPNIYYLQGFSGHGLALSGFAGRLVAEAIWGQASRFDVFAQMKHHPFPGGAIARTPMLVLGALYHRLRDCF